MNDPAPLERGVIGELFWKISDPVLIAKPDGILMLNPAAEKVFGVNSDDLARIGPEFETLLGDATEHFRAMIGSDSVARLDCHHLGMTFNARSFVVDGVSTVVILRDTTVEERHLASLRRLNEVAREVLRQDSVEIVLQKIVDEAKVLTDASFSALLMLKSGSDEEVAKFVYNAPRELFPARLPRAIGLLKVPIATRAPARLDDIRGHPAGVGIPVAHPPIGSLLAVPILAEGEVLGELAVANEPDRAVFTETDQAVLTELSLHAVQAIRTAQVREASAAANANRQAMLDLLRHDMMTPIATAKGATDLLVSQSGSLTEDQRDKLLKAVARSVEAIERMGRNLRSDARLEVPHLEADFSDIGVEELIEELKEDLQARAEERSISLLSVTEEDCPASFRGAQLLVRQALENLLTNAIKFSPTEQDVVITARSEGDSVRFDIRDKGPGIPLEDQSNLFLRFHRGDSKDDLPRIGLGLGLSIVK
ncbi:MAG TPA: ATP-binding protein, partial [Actinomycetota bacterium]|nr:ATP-binding protein [Actinomycetota bacterium]